MPIPKFTQFGLLPQGIFDCTEDEILERYCLNSQNRQDIWVLFKEFLRQPLPFTLPDHLFIDGGFTSDKLITSDIDVVADISHLDDMSAYMAIGWWTLNKKLLKESYRVDFWLKHKTIQQNLVDFFRYVKVEEALSRGLPKNEKKGLLKILI